MKISVLTPTVRPELLDIVYKSLQNQDFEDFEWLICSPMKIDITKFNLPHVSFIPGAKKEGEMYYTLNRDYNRLFRASQGELLISWQDGIYADPDALSKFAYWFDANPKGCVAAVGDQYQDLDEFGKPIHPVWKDPRKKLSADFYEVFPIDLEFSFCSMPRKAVFGVGGMDEDYDNGAAVGEKEMAIRMDKLGYKVYIDQALEYRAIKHPRLDDWEPHFNVATALYETHIKGLESGVRPVKLDFLS